MSTLPDYPSYLETFSVDDVIARLDDHRDGKANAFESCCGRHLRAGRGDVLALVHEDTQGQVNTLTYAELDAESAKLAGWFAERGLGVGDRIACMLPRSPELLVAVLAQGHIYSLVTPEEEMAQEVAKQKAQPRLMVGMGLLLMQRERGVMVRLTIKTVV